MGWLIDKIREWFCKHDWECLGNAIPVYDIKHPNGNPYKYKWVYVCRKCKKMKEIEIQG